MRNISMMLTADAILAKRKCVTRRLGWWKNAQPGTFLQPVRKSQGLKKGEKVEKLGKPIRVCCIRREALAEMLKDPNYGRRECVNEGFPNLTPAEFVAHFCEAMKCTPETIVTRIEFRFDDKE